MSQDDFSDVRNLPKSPPAIDITTYRKLMYSFREMVPIKESITTLTDGKSTAHFRLRTNTYCHTMDYLMWLYEQARKDFPTLRWDQVRVFKIGGDRYSGMTAISFSFGGTGHDAYAPVHRFDYEL